MVVKINNRRIRITDETEEDKGFSWVYLCVSTMGYVAIYCLLDYVSFVFFYTPLSSVSRWLMEVVRWFS